MELPKKLPEITIELQDRKPFEVLTSYGLDKEFGEKSYSGEYRALDSANRTLTVVNESYIKGLAKIHGEVCYEYKEIVGLMDGEPHELTEFFVVNEEYVKTIAAMEENDGVNVLLTCKDEEFYQHWGVGSDNCGEERKLKEKGIIRVDEALQLHVAEEKPGIIDVVGRYWVTIGEKKYDTIRRVFLADAGQVSDFFYDRQGREVLKRYFVPDEWGENYTQKYERCETIRLNDHVKVCVVYAIPDFVLEEQP